MRTRRLSDALTVNGRMFNTLKSDVFAEIAETVIALVVVFLIVKLSTRAAVANVSAIVSVMSVAPVRGEPRTTPERPLPLTVTFSVAPALFDTITVSAKVPTPSGANVTRIFALSVTTPIEPDAVNLGVDVVIPVTT